MIASISTPPTAKSDRGLDEWFTPGKFAGLLAVLIAAFFPEALFGGKAFVFRDFGIFTYPVAYFQRESFWHGQWPLWNPLNDCGVPFLAQWNTTALYPLSLIYILLPLSWGLTVFFLAHLFIAGFGMYLLAAHWTGNRFAAAVAGVAFVFNGMTLNCLMWASNLAALAWMPWVVLAAERAWTLGGRKIVLAALVGALQMLGGAPEIIALTWFILAALWVGSLVKGKQSRGNLLLRALLVVLLVSLLSAAQLLPFLDLLQHSERSSEMRAIIWPIPLWGWANLLLPLFHCYQSPSGVFFQPGQDWTSSYYAGIGVLALALLAIVLVRQPRVWLLTATALVGFVLAVGENGWLYGFLLKTVPALGFMRYPIKFAFLMTFALPLLAAFAVAWLQKSTDENGSKKLRWISAIGILLAGVVIALIVCARVNPFPHEQWPVIFQNGITRIVLLILVLGLVLASVRIQRPRSQIMTGVLALALMWLDVVTHAPKQNPTVDASVYAPGALAKRLEPRPQLGRARAFVTQPNYERVYNWMLPDTFKDYVGRRLAMLGNCNVLDDIPIPGGFFSLHVKEQRRVFLDLYNSPTNQFPEGLADFLAISHVSAPGENFQWQIRPSHLPFATVGPQPVFIESEKIPDLMLGSEFDPRRMVYLATDAERWLNVTNAAKGTVQPKKFTAHRIAYEVDADSPALLVISQTYYHPWRARVNGQTEKIWRANYAFQAVAVPAGRSTVELIYRDNAFLAGLALSIVTLVGCAIAWLRIRPLVLTE